MDYIANSRQQQKEMLQTIGISSIEELFVAIPTNLRYAAAIEDDGISELEGMRLMEAIAAKNSFHEYDQYLGGGAYEHHIPTIVDAIISKSEFLTSYTPYQPEVSQGMLQAIFEFQSAICALTGLDVANASLYDGASACAEAVLMSLRLNQPKNKVLIASTLHPRYQAVIRQYVQHASSELVIIPKLSDGSLDIETLNKELPNAASIIIQSPNFLGVIEQSKQIFELAKKEDALSILCANPIAYGLFSSAKEAGADIAVGDCQPFGVPLNFGGPYAGYMACKQEYVRQLPGRIAGETVDTNGEPGYVLTLQTREQHIRREKATSNICTNQALIALASLVSMAWYGKQGIPKLALTNYQRAAYLRHNLEKIKGITVPYSSNHFNEFVVRFDKPIEKVLDHFKKAGIMAGIPLKDWIENGDNDLLVCVTETKNLDQLNHFIQTAKQLF